MFTFHSFMVSYFTLKSLSHLEFIQCIILSLPRFYWVMGFSLFPFFHIYFLIKVIYVPGKVTKCYVFCLNFHILSLWQLIPVISKNHVNH